MALLAKAEHYNSEIGRHVVLHNVTASKVCGDIDTAPLILTSALDGHLDA